MLKREEETAAKELLSGSDVLPTGFGESSIYTVFALVREVRNYVHEYFSLRSRRDR